MLTYIIPPLQYAPFIVTIPAVVMMETSHTDYTYSRVVSNLRCRGEWVGGDDFDLDEV